jgi:hypothetical protein
MRLHANLLLLNNYHNFGNVLDFNVMVVEHAECLVVFSFLQTKLQI